MEAAFELMLPYKIHVLTKFGGRIACIFRDEYIMVSLVKK